MDIEDIGRRVIPQTTRRIIAVTSLVFFICFHLKGLDPGGTVDRYLVDQWEMADGLPSNTVLSIAQTPDGYLWIGTTNGLVRFDGMKFVFVRYAEKEELVSREIRDLSVDREGGLWIGSAIGLTLYRGAKHGFKNFTPADGITPDGIRRVTDDSKGNTWISFTASYVNRFANGTFTPFNETRGLSGKKINAFLEDRQGNLLLGSRENGIFIYKEGTFSPFLVPELENLFIIAMSQDRAGNLWVGTESGLFRIDSSTGTCTGEYTAGDGLSNDKITCILEDRQGNSWIGTRSGLNRLTQRQDGTVHIERLLESLPINCLLEDREKSLWIGSDTSGLKRLKDGKFRPYDAFERSTGEVPLSLFQDSRGNTWIGTVGGKLFCIHGKDLVAREDIPELSGTGIAAISEDAGGSLWLGTIGSGVFYKEKNRYRHYTSTEGLADNLVTSIYPDSRGNVWFSTFDGVSVLRPGESKMESLKSGDGLAGKVVHTVYESKTGEIWVGADKGITILPGTFAEGRGMSLSEVSPHTLLTGTSVTCIYEDPSDAGTGGAIFWIATDGSGLKRLRYPEGTMTAYTTAQGMTTNFLYQFHEDPRGDFWIMSNSGVLRVGKEELNSLAAGGTGIINCTSFGIADGMRSLEFDNEFSRNSTLKSRNGEFFFITKKGISVVNPGELRIEQTPPNVVIEAVYFNQGAVSLGTEVEPLTFKGMKRMSFYFTAPTFLSPEKTRFKYMLSEADREWVYVPPGKERVAHYQGLAPGDYTFRVTACNAEGVWNYTGESIAFRLKPYFYQHILFKIAVLLLLAASVAAAIYFYRKRKADLENKEKYKATPLHPDFAAECITRLNYLVEVEKVYCDAAISLQALADKLSVTSHQLSQLLNEKLDRNFADFINWNRIEEAKKILEKPLGRQRKISAVALDVGFNTMAAFYKAFNKYTGTTPTRYRKKAGKEK